MISVHNPWVIVVFTAALGGMFTYGHHKGWHQRDAEVQAEIAKANEESRAKEQKLTEQLTANATQLKEANDAVSKKQSDLDRAIRAGRVRLPAASCVQAPTGPAPTAGDQKDGAKSDGQTGPSADEQRTLELIAQIAADGDRAINQLNACVDAYNQVREQLNGHK